LDQVLNVSSSLPWQMRIDLIIHAFAKEEA